MNQKKKALAGLLIAAALIAGAYAGVQYYLDAVKPPEIAPAQVVERYFDALQNGRFEEAYNLVSRRHYFESFNQFIDRVSMYSPEMTLEILQEKIEGTAAVVSIHIVVPLRFGIYASDSEMDLVRDKREWKIVHP